jgi:hypothetical protein
MSNDNQEYPVEKIKEGVEDYLATIYALQAFVSLTTWDKQSNCQLQDSHYCIGRKMDTSPSNGVSPSNSVTPDAVIQRRSSLGYVVEAKKSLPQNVDNRWRSVVKQLEKYDDDLVGWWTSDQTIQEHCVVFLLELARAVDFAKYIDLVNDEEGWTFKKDASIVEFARLDGMKENVWLRKTWGQIKGKDISDALESGIKIPLEPVVASYGDKKFYDSPPNSPEHTMYIMWQIIFNEKKAEVAFDEERKAWPLDVNLDDLTSDLQRLYGSTGANEREVRFPKVKWVREAMDAFVKLNLAVSAGNGKDYIVLFKRITGDIIERFAKHRQVKEKTDSSDSPQQLSLL